MAIKEYQKISLDVYLKYLLCTSKLIIYILSWCHKVSLGSDHARSSTQKTHDSKRSLEAPPVWNAAKHLRPNPRTQQGRSFLAAYAVNMLV